MARRVLFLVTHMHKGGMQRAISNISIALSGQFEQHLAFFGTENPGYPFSGTVHDLQLPGEVAARPVARLRTLVHRIRRLRNCIRRNRIECVLSFGESANLYNIIALHAAVRIIGVRVAIEESLADAGPGGRLLLKCADALYPRADYLVCVSEELARRARDKWPSLSSRCLAIRNLYHIDEIRSQARAELPVGCPLRPDRRFVLAAGSFVRQKGFDLLLTCFARLKDIEDLDLVVLGDGPLALEIRSQSERLGLTGRTHFISFDRNPYRFMSRATVFVLPSRFEGFPNVLVEAMACGAPVVAFDCPTGPREIIGESEFGVLVPPESVSGLEAALRHVLGSEGARVRYKEVALRRALNFDSGLVSRRWADLLNSAKRFGRDVS